MDKMAKYQDLLTGAIAGAHALGVDLEIVANERHIGARVVDAVLQLRLNGQAVQFNAAIKPGLRPATLGVVLLQLKELEQLGQPVVLVTDYVTPQLADTLRENGVAFLDTAGNAYLNHPPLLIWVKGQKLPEKPLAERAAGRAFQATGLKVVFVLLCQPGGVGRPYREIAAIAGVAHGTVGWVMADLQEAGFVVKLKKTGRRLRNRRQLLDAWVEAYARFLRPRLLFGRYRAPGRNWWAGVNPLDYGLQLGAEPAAAELDHYLRPGIVTFYGDTLPGRIMAEHRLRADPEGDVELRRRFWYFEYEWEWPALVPPVLIYADLLAVGDARCVEAAQLFYENHLARFFEQD